MIIQRLVFIVGILCVLSACQGGQGPTAPDKAMAPAKAPAVSGAMLRHMHAHAEQLNHINVALRAGDLEAAGTPAYWLSRHDTIAGLPKGWRPYIAGMRAEARAVDVATDLPTARAAAARLADNCNGCHLANGKDITLRR